jgi:hypothetical protein
MSELTTYLKTQKQNQELKASLTEEVALLKQNVDVLKQYSPRIRTLHKSLIQLMKDTIELKRNLKETHYLIEMCDSKELVIAKSSDLKKAKNG